jgi:LacI family transcriptional regulator
MSVQLVSKEAGVSIATVSRVINHSRSVTPETVEVVRKAMARIGYIPPPVEKRQRRRSYSTSTPVGITRGNVALLFPDVDNRALRTALSGRFMHGVGEVLRARSVNLIVTPLAEGFVSPPCIRDGQVDAVIVRTAGGRAPEQLLPALQGLPVVWLLDGEMPARGDQIAEDNASIGKMAVRYLASRGCKRVACINSQGLHYSYRSRCDWFSIEARRAGLPCHEYIRHDAPEVALTRAEVWEPHLVALVDQLLATEPRPDGLFIPLPDDMITVIYRTLVDRGLRIGKDITLISCSYDPPRLATLDARLANIDIQAEAMGRAAVETLLWRLRHANEPQRRVMVLPSLVEGRSH